MEVLHERCCGLDVHKKSIAACVIIPEGKEIRTFGTMTQNLIELVDWLKDKRCSHVAMESTGDYWKIHICRHNITVLLGDEERRVMLLQLHTRF